LQAVALKHFFLTAVVAVEGQVLVVRAVVAVVVAVNRGQGKLGRYKLQAEEVMRV
jgi:hypothetical protein